MILHLSPANNIPPAFRLCFLCAELFCGILPSDALQIPMTPDHWTLLPPGNAEFVSVDSVPAIRIRSGAGRISLNDFTFTNGTIEFDVKPGHPDFVSFYFRQLNDDENEIVYLRTWNVGNPAATDTLQYSPTIKGVTLWNLLGHYQAACLLRSNQWNHLRLVISGARMRVFVNDPARPVLEVPRLEGNTPYGGLALEGTASFANLDVRPDEVDSLPPDESGDPTRTDLRYLRNWQLGQPMPLPDGRELFKGDLPKNGADWKPVEAERRGLVNLTRIFGKSESRRAVWLRLRLRAAAEMKRRIEFGFCDEVWVFLNGGLAYADKNLYHQPIVKPPNGRCSIENTSFILPLKAGDNELLVGVANDFYGWGIVARLDTLDGVEIVR